MTASVVSMDRLVSAERVFGTSGRIGPGWVAWTDGRIVASGHDDPPRRPDERLSEGILVPGLIDAQVNGSHGIDFAAANEADFVRVTAELAATGVTAVVPTFITAPIEEIADTLRGYARIRTNLAASTAGSRLLPAHVEGPFLAESRRGAHRADLLIDPTPDAIRRLVEAGGDSLGYVTLAPERRHGLEAVAQFVGAGVRVSIGHSDADARTVSAAADAGATLVTHLFNAQRPLHHREPGVVGAALADDRLTLGLIVDLHHVDAAAVRLTFTVAAGRIMIVTDSVSASGMPPGTYALGGADVILAEGQPPRRADGTIAGAVGRLDESIANAVACGVDVGAALAAVTSTPARALGQNDLGHLRPGDRADLAFLRADDFRAVRTWIGGVALG